MESRVWLSLVPRLSALETGNEARYVYVGPVKILPSSRHDLSYNIPAAKRHSQIRKKDMVSQVGMTLLDLTLLYMTLP